MTADAPGSDREKGTAKRGAGVSAIAEFNAAEGPGRLRGGDDLPAELPATAGLSDDPAEKVGGVIEIMIGASVASGRRTGDGMGEYPAAGVSLPLPLLRKAF